MRAIIRVFLGGGLLALLVIGCASEPMYYQVDGSGEQDEEGGSLDTSWTDWGGTEKTDEATDTDQDGTVDSATEAHETTSEGDTGDATQDDTATIGTELEDTATIGTEPEDTATIDTEPINTDPIDTDPHQPWEPNIGDSSYWKPYYPDTVEIYRTDTDQYMPGDFIDEDGDGFPWENDCDDRNGLIYPGRLERADPPNGFDDNCNCKIDEDPTDVKPAEGCPTDWWDHNFRNTWHTEWTITNEKANSVQAARSYCYQVGHSWRVPSFEEAADAFVVQGIGVDPATGEPSNAEGSCWCDWPWGGDALGQCGPPIWVEGEIHAELGVMRCDAYIKNIGDPDGGYLPPSAQMHPADLVSGSFPVVCARRMPNGIE